MLYRRIACLFVSLILSLVYGCDSSLYNQTQANVAEVTQQAADARHAATAKTKPAPTLVVNQGLYVDKTPINLAKQPTWLKNHIIIRGDELPFSYYSRTIASGGSRHILIHYQTGLDQNIKISLNFSGTVREALDMLASKTGYAYTVVGGHIYWQAFVTKTFEIAFMPGSSDYVMGKTGSTGGASGGGGGGGSNTTVTGTIDDSAASQYSNLQGKISVWKDVEDSIKQLLSPDGKVIVSQATTSVTVKDRPSNISLIGKFIDNLNHNLSKQVLIKVQVLEVSLDTSYNFGINWSIIQGAFGGSDYQLQSNNGTPISIDTLGGVLTTLGLQRNSDRTTGFTILVNALKQQGKVTVVTEPRVLCQNNQVSAVRIIKQEGYLASVQTTTLSGSSTGGASITSQITPGSLITGMTLYVLPKILGNKVYLQINADISNSLGIKSINSATGTTPTSDPVAGSSVIQVPNVQQKQFNQRSVIASGNTLILSGFRQISNQADAQQLFDSQALGGKSALQTMVETIVLITPIVLPGLA